jgi:hypothetical protein
MFEGIGQKLNLHGIQAKSIEMQTLNDFQTAAREYDLSGNSKFRDEDQDESGKWLKKLQEMVGQDNEILKQDSSN